MDKKLELFQKISNKLNKSPSVGVEIPASDLNNPSYAELEAIHYSFMKEGMRSLITEECGELVFCVWKPNR